MTTPGRPAAPTFSTSMPAPARMYDYCLGGKDNYVVDREAVLAVCAQVPDALDAPRANRQFLYRVVRFLAQEAGIRQFLDMGSGLPTQNNVHEVARRFQPDAQVVYVDNDPLVLVHGQALLPDDDTTTIITADITDPEKILAHPDVRRLIDFSAPVATLFLSVAHFVEDEATVHRMIDTVMDAVVPGSYLVFSQIVGPDRETTEQANEIMRSRGVIWKDRLREDVLEFVRGLEPVEPGLVNVKDWRPDPFQPKLAPVDEPLRPFLGRSKEITQFMELGGVFRKA